MKKIEEAAVIKKLMAWKHFPKLAVISGVAVMLMIMLTDSGREDKKADSTGLSEVFTVSDNYTAYSEKKLAELLASIEGVGKNKVMVSLSGTEEYIYAEELKLRESQSENSFVIYDSGNEKTPLLKKVASPSVSGIIVVCEGGDDPKICEQVYKVISTAFNIPTNRIYVAEMK